MLPRNHPDRIQITFELVWARQRILALIADPSPA